VSLVDGARSTTPETTREIPRAFPVSRLPGYLALGQAVTLLPSDVRSTIPATLRIPLDPAALASRHATTRDVRLLRVDDPSGGPSPVVTRPDASLWSVEAEVSQPGTYVAALVSTTPCFVTPMETCASRACALAAYVDAVAGLSGGLRTDLAALAHAACTAATPQPPDPADYQAAVAALDEFLSRLSLALAMQEMPKGLHDDLSWRAQEARTVLVQVPTVDVTGTWLASLATGTAARAVALQLHQRADGTVMGYALGSADALVVTSGFVGLDQLHLVLDLRDGGEARIVSLHTTSQIATMPEGDPGATLSGFLQDERGMEPVVLVRTVESLAERRFAFLGGESGGGRADLALLVGSGGTLVAGGLHSDDCEWLPCGGDVYAYAEDPASQHLWVFFRGPDGRVGSIDAAVDAMADLYGGTWQTQLPGRAPKSGSLTGFRSTGTSATAAAAALLAYGRLADDIEARHDFTAHLAGAPHPSIDPSFRHDGLGASALLTALSTEVALYDRVEVDFDSFRNLRGGFAAADPDIHAAGRAPAGVVAAGIRSRWWVSSPLRTSAKGRSNWCGSRCRRGWEPRRGR